MNNLKFILITILATMLYGCGTQQVAQKTQAYRQSPVASRERQQEMLRNKYGDDLEIASLQVCKAVSKHLSPNTGKDFKAVAHLYEGITENKSEGWISCPVTLQWQAKTSLFGSENDCEVQGTLYYYPSYRKIDPHKAWFVGKKHNRHVGNLSGGSWSKISQGIMVTLE